MIARVQGDLVVTPQPRATGSRNSVPNSARSDELLQLSDQGRPSGSKKNEWQSCGVNFQFVRFTNKYNLCLQRRKEDEYVCVRVCAAYHSSYTAFASRPLD